MRTNYMYGGSENYFDIVSNLTRAADSIIYSTNDTSPIMTISLDNCISAFGHGVVNMNGGDRMFKIVGNKVGGGIKKVIFNDPATIVYWNTEEKTVVKCAEGEVFDKEKGLLCAILKYECGNGNEYHRLFKDWCD